jgi:uncharacterized membrane protein YccC
MNAWDRLFWLWFAVAGFLFVWALYEQYSLASLFFCLVLVGLGLLKLAHERPQKVSRRLLEKLKSI